ncbi:MAG: hypothetical protein ACUVQR_08460, partial [Thermogutta sp.]
RAGTRPAPTVVATTGLCRILRHILGKQTPSLYSAEQLRQDQLETGDVLRMGQVKWTGKTNVTRGRRGCGAGRWVGVAYLVCAFAIDSF